MRVLVTGASGLLGANVVEELIAHGYDVDVLIRKTSNTVGICDLNPKIHYGDLQDQASIIRVAKNCQAIIHCAANTKQWNTSKKEHELVNIAGTRNILEAACMAGTEKLVYVSTANTFPILNNPDLYLNTDYIATKRAAEEFILTQQRMPAVVINPSFMIGARDVNPSSGQLILHYLNNNPVFTPAGGKSFIHVKDVSEAIRKSLESDFQGKGFLLANENRSYQSFFKLIGKVTGQNKNLVVVPTFISSFAGIMGSFYGKISGTSPKLNLENAEIINNKLFYDGEPTYQELDIQKRPLEAAIAEAVEWFKANGYC